MPVHLHQQRGDRHQRFTALRQSRRRADGAPYSLAGIAASYGSAPRALTALSHGKGLPGRSAATGIQNFVPVHAAS